MAKHDLDKYGVSVPKSVETFTYTGDLEDACEGCNSAIFSGDECAYYGGKKMHADCAHEEWELDL